MFLPLARRFKSAFIMLSSAPKTGAHEVKIPRFCLASRLSLAIAGFAETHKWSGLSREMTAADVESWIENLSTWGRWREDDQFGALNLITAEKRRASAALVVDGVSGEGRHGVAVQPNRDVLRVSNAVSFHAVEPDQRASADSFEPDQRAQEP